jgi:glycosyltransferase involved in cell wall biosynthesis
MGMDKQRLSQQADERPALLAMFPGPTYRLEEAYAMRFGGLSGRFRGAVMTSAPRHQKTRFGDFDVTVISDDTSKFLRRFRYLAAALPIARALFKGTRKCLVVTYDPLMTGIIGLVVARLCSAKFICEVNGDYADDAIYMHIENPLSRRLKQATNVIVARFVLRRCDGIKTLHHRQLSSLNVETNNRPVATYPSYCPIDRFTFLDDQPEILLAGFPFHIKGVDVLLAAFNRISADHPAWRLTVIGHYPDRELLDAAIAHNPQVTVKMPVLHSDMPEIIGRCGILVLPSRTEGMGRVLVEAMAAGKPRIGSSVGGIPTTIEDGVDGLLVPPDDVEALAEALDTLMGSKELRQRLGSAGQRRALNEFSSAEYFRKSAEFYDSVLDG